MNTAQKGANLERYIRQLLEADGWSVIRGASSKGEALGWKADLVATKYTDQTRREVWLAIMQMKVKKR
jgi:Holliday junction resolvase